LNLQDHRLRKTLGADCGDFELVKSARLRGLRRTRLVRAPFPTKKVALSTSNFAAERAHSRPPSARGRARSAPVKDSALVTPSKTPSAEEAPASWPPLLARRRRRADRTRPPRLRCRASPSARQVGKSFRNEIAPRQASCRETAPTPDAPFPRRPTRVLSTHKGEQSRQTSKIERPPHLPHVHPHMLTKCPLDTILKMSYVRCLKARPFARAQGCKYV